LARGKIQKINEFNNKIEGVQLDNLESQTKSIEANSNLYSLKRGDLDMDVDEF
jgi:hypothetical protein